MQVSLSFMATGHTACCKLFVAEQTLHDGYRIPFRTTVSVHIHNYKEFDIAPLNMNTLVNKLISYYSN